MTASLITSLPILPTAHAKPGRDPVSDVERQRIAEDLSRLNVGEVRFDRHNRLLYSTDASLYQVEPIGVVVPIDADAVTRVVNYCNARGLAVLPRGGGTSLAGQCTNRAIVIDLSPTCRRILSVDVAGRQCCVEPGIGIDELNRELSARGTGLFFAPDPATVAQAAIGGCIGNNAAGARSIRYGRTSENVAGVEVVLSTAERVWLEPGAGRRSPIARRLAEQVAAVVRANADEIRRRFPNLIRRNAGYGLDLILRQLDAGVADEDLDLSGLLCGSEGTLAVTLAAKLKLHPLPKVRGLAVVSFVSLDRAIAAVVPILAIRPSAVELLDDVVLRAAAGNTETRPYLELLPTIAGAPPAAALYVEFQAEESIDQLDGFFTDLRKVLPDSPVAVYRDPTEMNQAWTLRKAAEALLHGLPGKAKPVTFVEDNSVPVGQLCRFVDEFRQIVARHGTEAAYYAHASVGVLHVRPMIDLHNAAGRRTLREIAVEVADLARRCGGVMSGEHGDGRVRGPLLESFYGAQITSAFQQIKAIFDPAGIFNPGNIVAAGPIESITQNLRVDAEGDTFDLSKLPTFFNYPGSEGFAEAVEQCNGAGFCRKTAGGTMCPSYRATLDERHSTRGRANAVRVAVTGQGIARSSGNDAGSKLPGLGSDTLSRADSTNHMPQWNDAGVLGTLDLCLSCKACKTECPSNVDVAQLKSEYLAQRYRQIGGAPLRARLFGNVRLLNRIGSFTPRLANAVNRLPPVRAVLNKVLQLAPKRSIPPFAPSLFRWFAKRPATKPGGKPRVALWADCFVTYSEPHIGKAAVALLEGLGYSVELPKGGCCGRPMISTGLLEQAIRTADSTLQSLRKLIHDSEVEAIIVLEPSCLSAIKDEWLKLKLKTDLPTRQKLAAKAMLIEDFVESRWKKHPLNPTANPLARDLVVHGHCHQKALWGMDSTVAVLRRITGGRVEFLPSGCCGMAGSFGYTADHYDLSMKIGELSLFPPVRAAHPNAIIVAAGTSCRHQIMDGTGRHCLHPAEVLATALINLKLSN